MVLDRRVILFVSICIVAGAVLIGLTQVITPRSAPTQSQTEQTTDEDEQTPAPSTEVSYPLTETQISDLSEQTKREFNFAFEQARRWRADAVFTAARITYEKVIDPARGKNTFIFSSPALPMYYWTITLDQEQNIDGTNNYERTIYYKEDYAVLSGDVIDAPLKYYKVDYVNAIKIADDLGGKAVRSSNPEYSVEATLAAKKGELLVWHITYLVDDEVRYETDINAFTGEEVLDVTTPAI